MCVCAACVASSDRPAVERERARFAGRGEGAGEKQEERYDNEAWKKERRPNAFEAMSAESTLISCGY